MRTVGKFSEIYKQTREYLKDENYIPSEQDVSDYVKFVEETTNNY